MKPEIKKITPNVNAGLRCCVLSILMAPLILASCARTVTVKKRTYSISKSGAGTEADDSDKLRDRYASGFEVGEDGGMKSNKRDLYQDDSFKNSKSKDAPLKSFRSGKKDKDIKEYRTPEYLTRQKNFRTKDSRMNKEARESDVDRFTSASSSREAKIKSNKPGFLDWLNPFSKNKSYWGANKNFSTSTDRAGTKAIGTAPVPEPMSTIGAGPQDQVSPSLSMDDVKKMLNPSAYRTPKQR